MKKVKIVNQEIRLSSILALEIEVNGFNKTDSQGRPIYSIQGIINQKMDAKTKYWLGKLSNKLLKERKQYDELRNDLIKKYGGETKDADGNETYSIPEKIQDPEYVAPKRKRGEKPEPVPMIINPNMELFRNEQLELLRQTVKIDLPKFDIEELFSFQTEFSYVNAGELLVQDDDPNFVYQDLEFEEEEES